MELDIRFAGLQKLVIERQPKNIAVNYMDDFSTASSSEFSPLTDGISHKDYNLLIETLGKKYAKRVKSAEYLIMDYIIVLIKFKHITYSVCMLVSPLNVPSSRVSILLSYKDLHCIT